MRKKIREIMNKEEGFTLVELLAVLAILAIIVAIAVPAIGNVIDNSQEKATDAEVELIEDAARLYDIEKPITVGTGKGVPVDTLISEGFLELRGREDLEGSVEKIEVEDGKGFNYEYKADAKGVTPPAATP